MKNQNRRDNDELKRRREIRNRRRRQEKKKKRKQRIYAGLGVLFMAAALGTIVFLIARIFNAEYIDPGNVTIPQWVEQDFFDVNPYSRPGTSMNEVNGIVIHYVANPGTTARQNWNYFNNLKDQTGENTTSASSHFLIGLEGEALQGIPLNEIAYATSREKNMDTISIECCHPDETGKFTEAAYNTLVELTAQLCCSFNLTERDVIRHYDATGKDCPRYFVAHKDEWKQFLKDVKTERKKLVREKE